jgi:cyclopropane-fatty-acyl-phospholipid synthase
VIESRVEKKLAELKQKTALPLTIELWNGKRFPLSDNPSVTLRVSDVACAAGPGEPEPGESGRSLRGRPHRRRGPIDEALRTAAALSEHLGQSKTASDRVSGTCTAARATPRRSATTTTSPTISTRSGSTGAWSTRARTSRPGRSIDEAQEQKLDHICRKLRLSPGERFLDIGCGWGALVMLAAERYGVHATGITLSENQHALANERIRAAGLQDRCQVLLQDYRDLTGEAVFDKIASVGMFEHVGLKNLPTYFGAIQRWLAPGGIAMNHGLTSIDPESRSVGLGAGEFIEKYVFPHGELPHLSLVVKEMGAAGLEVMDCRDAAPALREDALALVAAARSESGRGARAHRRQAAAHLARLSRRLRARVRAQLGHDPAGARGEAGDPARNPLPWTRDYIYR